MHLYTYLHCIIVCSRCTHVRLPRISERYQSQSRSNQQSVAQRSISITHGSINIRGRGATKVTDKRWSAGVVCCKILFYCRYCLHVGATHRGHRHRPHINTLCIAYRERCAALTAHVGSASVVRTSSAITHDMTQQPVGAYHICGHCQLELQLQYGRTGGLHRL